MKDPNIEEKVFEIDGIALKVLTAISQDKKNFEISIEAAAPLNQVYVAKVLELVGSLMLKGIYIPPQIYAKEML